MKRYLIEDAKCGISDGGIDCGPVPGHVVTSVKFSDGEESRWLNLAEVDGMPNVYLTEEEVYEAMIKDDPEDETLTERLEEDYIEGLDGIAFGMDYSETFASIAEDPDSPAVPLIKYMIALTRCEMGDVQSLLKLGIDMRMSWRSRSVMWKRSIWKKRKKTRMRTNKEALLQPKGKDDEE